VQATAGRLRARGGRSLGGELADGRRGRAFGSYNLTVGVAALTGDTGFGLVWDVLGSEAAFAGSGAVALLAAALLRRS
jgi:hypothetical protein